MQLPFSPPKLRAWHRKLWVSDILGRQTGSKSEADEYSNVTKNLLAKILIYPFWVSDTLQQHQ